MTIDTTARARWTFEGRVVVITNADSDRGRTQQVAFSRANATVVAAPPRALDDEDAWRTLARRVAEEHARLDVLVVNDAGLGRERLLDLPPDGWDMCMAANVTAGYLAAKHLVPLMVAARYGKVVFTTGPETSAGFENAVALCASRHATHGLAKALACELGRHQVNVNTVAASAAADQGDAEALATLAHTVMWLGSDASRFVTGALVETGPPAGEITSIVQ